VGKITPQKLPSLKGLVNLQSGAPKPEENPNLNIQFKIQQLAISGNTCLLGIEGRLGLGVWKSTNSSTLEGTAAPDSSHLRTQLNLMLFCHTYLTSPSFKSQRSPHLCSKKVELASFVSRGILTKAMLLRVQHVGDRKGMLFPHDEWSTVQCHI
jgi:hypothetical protein